VRQYIVLAHRIARSQRCRRREYAAYGHQYCPATASPAAVRPHDAISHGRRPARQGRRSQRSQLATFTSTEATSRRPLQASDLTCGFAWTYGDTIRTCPDNWSISGSSTGRRRHRRDDGDDGPAWHRMTTVVDGGSTPSRRSGGRVEQPTSRSSMGAGPFAAVHTGVFCWPAAFRGSRRCIRDRRSSFLWLHLWLQISVTTSGAGGRQAGPARSCSPRRCPMESCAHSSFSNSLGVRSACRKIDRIVPRAISAWFGTMAVPPPELRSLTWLPRCDTCSNPARRNAASTSRAAYVRTQTATSIGAMIGASPISTS